MDEEEEYDDGNEEDAEPDSDDSDEDDIPLARLLFNFHRSASTYRISSLMHGSLPAACGEDNLQTSRM